MYRRSTMQPSSLALRTDLIFRRFSGEVIDRGEYLVVRTASRPNYFWGNYLIMKHPPGVGDVEKWIGLFEKEIGPKSERGFIALTWDSINGEQGVIQPFLDFGFSVHRSTILTAGGVCRPPKYNPELVVRPFKSEEDWERYNDIHFDPDWEYGNEESQRKFLTKGREHLRAMADCGLGVRFGAEMRGKLAGEAGIYWDGHVGRFNNVGTHRDYRRRGVCSTLVYLASKFAFETKGIKTLVMEADEDYHAARIYESVGFKPVEKLIALEWYDKSKF
jgi:RimJ/RimL family protein N-acetyltransferase